MFEKNQCEVNLCHYLSLLEDIGDLSTLEFVKIFIQINGTWKVLRTCEISPVRGASVLLRTTQPPPRLTYRHFPPTLLPSRSSTRPFQGLCCIHLTSSVDIPLSLLLPPPAHCHWSVPSLSSPTTTDHLVTRHL
jgi:hypothetical protein